MVNCSVGRTISQWCANCHVNSASLVCWGEVLTTSTNAKASNGKYSLVVTFNIDPSWDYRSCRIFRPLPFFFYVDNIPKLQLFWRGIIRPSKIDPRRWYEKKKKHLKQKEKNSISTVMSGISLKKRVPSGLMTSSAAHSVRKKKEKKFHFYGIDITFSLISLLIDYYWFGRCFWMFFYGSTYWRCWSFLGTDTDIDIFLSFSARGVLFPLFFSLRHKKLKTGKKKLCSTCAPCRPSYSTAHCCTRHRMNNKQLELLPRNKRTAN